MHKPIPVNLQLFFRIVEILTKLSQNDDATGKKTRLKLTIFIKKNKHDIN